MGQYSIKEVEILSGVKAHTLRIWEQRYQFLKPLRTDTNIRYYSDDQLRLLLNVSTLNRNGIKISKIAEMELSELANEVLKINETSTDPDNFLDTLIQTMIDFDERRFDKTMNTAIGKIGLEQTFIKLIFPFMARTGVLWTTGGIRIAQEHFISNLIRRKILVAIDNQYVEVTAKSKKFVLFLPEGEVHELLLLFIEYLLRKQNHIVAYIGTSVPYKELNFISEAFNPDFLVTYLTLPFDIKPFQDYTKQLEIAYPKCKIIVGGSQLQQHKTKLGANCIPVQSAEDLLAAII